DGGGFEVFQVGIVDQHDLAGFFHVDDPFRLLQRSHDGCDARLGVVVAVDSLAAGGDDLDGLERFAVHDGVLGRPIGAADQVLVFVALELGDIDGSCVGTQPDGSHGGGFFEPHVDDGGEAVAAYRVHVAARCRQAGDVHRVAGIENLPDLVVVAVYQCELAGVAQGNGKDVLQVDIVELFLGAL